MKAERVTLTKHGPPDAEESAIALSVLFFENDEGWTAQCLEVDIAAQAETLEALCHEVERVLVAHIMVARELGREPFDGLQRAPQRYWHIFDKSRLSVQRPAARYAVEERETPLIHPRIRIAETSAA